MELEQIKNIVDKVVGFDITAKKRQIEYVDARRIFYKIARTKTKHSFASIGNFLNRDHATALHGIKQFDILISQNEFLKYHYDLSLKIIKDNGFDALKDAKTLKEIKKSYTSLIEDKNIELKKIALELENLKKQKLETVTRIESNVNNPIVRDLLSRDDETINFIAETRLKPALKMLDSRITHKDLLKNRPKSQYI